jgi:hypothetical protein
MGPLLVLESTQCLNPEIDVLCYPFTHSYGRSVVMKIVVTISIVLRLVGNLCTFRILPLKPGGNSTSCDGLTFNRSVVCFATSP